MTLNADACREKLQKQVLHASNRADALITLLNFCRRQEPREMRGLLASLPSSPPSSILISPFGSYGAAAAGDEATLEPFNDENSPPQKRRMLARADVDDALASQSNADDIETPVEHQQAEEAPQTWFTPVRPSQRPRSLAQGGEGSQPEDLGGSQGTLLPSMLSFASWIESPLESGTPVGREGGASPPPSVAKGNGVDLNDLAAMYSPGRPPTRPRLPQSPVEKILG